MAVICDDYSEYAGFLASVFFDELVVGKFEGRRRLGVFRNLFEVFDSFFEVG